MRENTLKDIGGRIRELRIAAGLSQSELAARMGYSSKTTIAKIEGGKIDIPQSKIVLFAEVLNTTITYLIDGEEGYYANEDTMALATAMMRDPQIRALFDVARKARPEDITLATDSAAARSQ